MTEHTMISACACMPPREQDMEDASVPGHPFVHTVDSASSVEAEDLFNNMHRIVITNLADRDMWQEISMVNLNAHQAQLQLTTHPTQVARRGFVSGSGWHASSSA